MRSRRNNAAVGVEADKRHLVVDEVLRQQARDHRFADPAFFATDQVDLGLGQGFERGR
jgi:hypothetical protein